MQHVLVNRKCAVCDDFLTENNKSQEHILPKSIGGRRKTADFICKSCNNYFGSSCDAELSKQFSQISTLVNVAREDGKVYKANFRSSLGDSIIINAKGEISIETAVKRESDKYRIKTNNIKDLKKIVRGIGEKHDIKDDIPKLLDRAEKDLSITKEAPTILIDYPKLGLVFGQSVVKTAFAMASYIGILHSFCKEAVEFLKDSSKPNYNLFFSRDLILERPENLIFHCVAISAQPDKRLLLGYVEYYSAFRFVVILSKNYTGKKLYKCHAIDPETKKQFNLKVNLNLSEQEIEDVLSAKKAIENMHRPFLIMLKTIPFISSIVSDQRLFEFLPVSGKTPLFS